MLRSFVRRAHGPLSRACVIAAALVMGSCERKPSTPSTASTQSSVRGIQEGDFEGSWNAAGMRRSIPLGGGEADAGRTASTIDLRGTMLLAGAGRPGVGFRAEVVALVDSETGLVGRGVWTDEHGDQVFSELKGEGTKERNRITGTIIGGTGRFAGVTGSYEFSWAFVIEAEDGAVQGRAEGLKGRYRIDPVKRGGAAAPGAAAATGGDKR
jgi:hypothetical protein